MEDIMFGKNNPENEAKVGTAVEPEAKRKKSRKVKSRIQNNLVTIEVVMGEGVEPSTLEFDTSQLSQVMKDKLMPYGASTRLVGSAGGKSAQKAVDAIKAAWQGLLDSSWSPRKPADNISRKKVKEQLALQSEEKQKRSKVTLTELGIEL